MGPQGSIRRRVACALLYAVCWACNRLARGLQAIAVQTATLYADVRWTP